MHFNKIDLNNVFKVIPVDFDPQTFDSYYNGCCNGTFWPLFHSMPDRAQFSVEFWKVIIDVTTTTKYCNKTNQCFFAFS